MPCPPPIHAEPMNFSSISPLMEPIHQVGRDATSTSTLDVEEKLVLHGDLFLTLS